ncbi:hypothetical protein [Salinivibrio sp. VYel1]|uniref:hypothetical protein n=1 Tax=Salinivibrio sp. VYel1 TaxID=2490490 RepID=UPI00128D51C8|nr:hypothetical protein [Salinivibrio sp. VYel1]MPX92112.1 hypothetical protein [Salinivibrio sp. VYel1]
MKGKVLFYKILKKLRLFPVIYTIDRRWKEKKEKARNKRPIVLFAGHQCSWSTLHQRPQNIAKEFANQGYQVIYCISPYVNDKPDSEVYGYKEIEPNIYLYGDIEGWSFDEEISLIYACYASQLKHVERLRQKSPNAKIIFDVFDEPELFGYDSDNLEYNKLLSLSDLTLYSADKLRPSVGRKLMYAPNGVDVSHFKNQNYKYKCCYFGAIDTWFDFVSVREAAVNNPNVVFFFAGVVNKKCKSDFESITSLNNVIFLGKLDYSIIPSVFIGFDFGIIPFKINRITDSVNPIKMHEYLAMNLTVISSAIHEVKKYEEYVYLYGQDNKLTDVVSGLTSGPFALEKRETIESHTWSKLCGAILKEL